jgi:hypothetical protein
MGCSVTVGPRRQRPVGRRGVSSTGPDLQHCNTARQGGSNDVASRTREETVQPQWKRSFSLGTGAVSAGAPESELTRHLKEMNFPSAHRSSNPTTPATQSVSPMCANSPAKPPALPERIEAVLQLRELGHEVIRSPWGTAISHCYSQLDAFAPAASGVCALDIPSPWVRANRLGAARLASTPSRVAGLGSGLPSAEPNGFPEFEWCSPDRFQPGGQVYQGGALPLSYGSEVSITCAFYCGF